MFEQNIIAERFRQKLHCTCTQSLHSHVCVSMRSNEDGWDSAVLGVQPGLQVEAGHSRHANVGD
jgi:hypothetical protein